MVIFAVSTSLHIHAFPSDKLIKLVDEALHKMVQSIEAILLEKGWSVAVAESCTGGGIAAALTSVPGSSGCVKGGIVAYTEDVKMRILGVSSQILQMCGVVSERTVVEMAKGAMKAMNSHFAVATSGVAGPSGGSKEVPVGTIWIAVTSQSQIYTHCIRNFNEGRGENTRNAVREALEILKKIVEKEENQS